MVAKPKASGTTRAILNGEKVNQFQNEQRYLLREMPHGFDGSYLAGGAITSVFSNSEIKDFDIYFKSQKDFFSALESAYSKGFWCVALTTRAITFQKDNKSYQFMHFNWFPEAKDIFDSFDFTACMGALCMDTPVHFDLHPRFLVDVSRRELVFNHKTAFPLASGMRVWKYIDKGYTISKKEFLKVITACMFKKVNSWEELKEQIGGSYGECVAMDTSKPFTLDSAMEALAGAHFESKTEVEPPDNAEDATEAIKGEFEQSKIPSNAKEAMDMIEALNNPVVAVAD